MLTTYSHVREFGNCRLDLDKKVLWHADEPVSLPAKAVEVLCELLERPGEVVTKDELLDRVWRDAFVEEGVLSQSIHQLRRTFRDLELQGELIQTIPRRGYRFVGEASHARESIVVEHEILEREVLAEIGEDPLPLREKRPIESKPSRRSFTVVALIAVAAVVIVAAVAWNITTRTQTPAGGIGSLAVLPLRSLNENDDNQTLSLGLTDSLIVSLGRLNRFTVRPFTAVESFDRSGKDSISFARDLRTDSVLEGTIQTSHDRVRVSLKLIDVRNGSQIWAESFDEAETDILKLQDLISSRVARAILIKLNSTDEELLARSPTINPEAYRNYISGRQKWLSRNWTADSLAFYQNAIELDPNFALAYIGIADHYAFTYETVLAEDALNNAIALEPTLAEAHATRGFLQMFHRWDWPAAETSLRRAIELAPNSAKAHHWYGVYLSIRGKHDEAIAEMERALELDPTALVIMTDIAEINYFKREFQLAEAGLQKVIEIDPTFRNARERLTKVRYKNGNSYFLENAALDVYLQRLSRTEGRDFAFATDELERLIAAGDERTLVGKYLAVARDASKLRPDQSLGLSKFLAITGDRDECLDALEKAVEARSFVLPFIAVDPIWDPVRDDPRFKNILRRMNL